MKDAQSYDFQEYVTKSCKRGFTGTNVSAQCIDVDKWSQPSPICKGKAFILEMHKVDGEISTKSSRKLIRKYLFTKNVESDYQFLQFYCRYILFMKRTFSVHVFQSLTETL